MMNKSRAHSLPMPKNLQRAFESAVRDVYEVSRTGKPSRYRTPIASRAGSGEPESSINAEKRALTDAAKALAQLWRVAPASSR